MNPSPLLECPAGAGKTDTPGALCTSRGVRYRVWAPDHDTLSVRVEGPGRPREIPMERDAAGYFTGADAAGRPGDLYRYQLGGAALPDPASRFQPRGVDGPSRVVDPSAFVWTCRDWKRPALRARVIYELHVGAFTPEGTFAAATAKLGALAELGVNTLELMPLADFAGERNWGYDGVLPYAPARCYGEPDELRAFVDAAHRHGLAVVLDVVYNHLGPWGNVFPRYASAYFHEGRSNVWGQAINFAEPAVREFFLGNVRHWLDEYRLDGLRLDATHALEDDSPNHILADIAATARARGAFVIAEDERNEVCLITPFDAGGWGLDAVWADDFHHTVRVALTRQREAHFASFEGTIAECARTLRHGWLYQGQMSPHRGEPRGTPAAHRPPEQFVHCISNHDQVGNRPLGERLHESISPESYRALSMLLCLSPYTPMLFMGQEWAAGSPFVFFTDHPSEVGGGIAEGRRREFAHYGANYDARTLELMPDPQSADAFAQSKLDWAERGRPPHNEVLALYRACLRLRASEPLFQNPSRSLWAVDQVAENLLGLRWTDPQGDWLLLVGLAPGRSAVAAHPLIDRAPGRRWQRVLASNDPAFGGDGSSGAVSIGREGIVLFSPGAVLLREV